MERTTPSMETWRARLYLEATLPDEKDQLDESLPAGLDIKSIITLFVYEYLRRPRQIQVTLIERVNDKPNPFEFLSLDKTVVTNVFSSHQPPPTESQLAKLPAIVLVNDDGATTVISGLCSVCRTIVQLSGEEEILGFKRGCLAAPAEASVWTKFCEIDALRFIQRLMGEEEKEVIVDKLDDELARFEMHLKQPVRIHNFAKVVQDLKRTEDTKGYCLERDFNDTLVIKHQFVEGPKMFLADLILFCVFYFVFRRLPKKELKDVMPLTIKWFETMEVVVGTEILDRLTRKMVRRFNLLFDKGFNVNLMIPLSRPFPS